MRFQRQLNASQLKSETYRECPPGRRHPRRDHQGHGIGNPGRRPGRGRGGRAGRGDLRHAILWLLSSEPMHGYQIITIITERTNGNWTPSPGAIYPTLSMLEDEQLITISTQSGRKMARLTAEGAQCVAENEKTWSGILEAYRDPGSRESGIHNIRSEYYKIRELLKAAPEGNDEKIIQILRKAADDIKNIQP